MNRDVYEGCLIGCGIIAFALFVTWLITVAFIWLLCFILTPLGVVFDLRVATAVWLSLLFIGWFLGSVNNDA